MRSTRQPRRRQRTVAAAGLTAAILVSVAGVVLATTVADPDGAAHRASSTPRRAEVEHPTPSSAAALPLPHPACVADPSLGQPTQPAPPELALATVSFAADPRVAGNAVGLSVWIDGLGEVLTVNPDLQLAPASNQKLFTAMGALAVLGSDAHLTTQLRLTGHGDLVIVPGGDPTITTSGPHSLDALAVQMRDAGVPSIAGALFVDETRHDGARRAPGWQDWQIPTYTGPLSAFVVDDNRWRNDPAYLADPALANAERLRAALLSNGITIAGGTGYGGADAGSTAIATLESPPIGELVHDMLQRSDNQTADSLLEEVAVAATGRGSLAGGAAAAHAALESLCVPLGGTTDDGSGLSRSNQRSAREWRQLLQAARATTWWPTLFEGLPIAGRSGTLSHRMRGTAAEGNVHAKTGTIIGGSALSGYGTTGSGRAFVFSVIVNGPAAEQAAAAIDTLVASIARLAS